MSTEPLSSFPSLHTLWQLSAAPGNTLTFINYEDFSLLSVPMLPIISLPFN